MKPLDLLLSSIRSINRNRMRALLTMLGIIIGVGAVIGMMAIGKGSEESIKGELGRLGSNTINIMPARDNARNNYDVLREKDVAVIERHSSAIAHITPIVSSQVQAVNGANNIRPSITGAYASYFEIQSHKVQYGQLFDEETGHSLQKVCVIGKTVAVELFGSQEAAVGQIIRLNKIPFRVLGVLEEKGQGNFGSDRDNVVVAPFQSVQKRIMGVTFASTIAVAAESEDLVETAKVDINDALLNELNKVSGGEPTFEIMTMKEIMDVMGTVTGMLTILLAAVASISLVVGGIGIMNIMLVSVKERTREIGLRLAVGAPGNAILVQFLVEAVIISLLGGVLGILLGYIIAQVAGNLLGWTVEITPDSVGLAFGFSFLIGVVFGFFPARQASLLHPIEALRYE